MSVDVDRFLIRIVGTVHERLSADGELASRLTRLVDRAKAAWPTLALDGAQFLDYVADRIPPEASPGVLEDLFAEDLYLAAGCTAGNSEAMRACERAYGRDIERGLDSVQLPVTLRDEVWSRLRERIFVSIAGEPPAIATFSGRGSLGKWLRVAATRLALNAMRETRREAPIDDLDLRDTADDLALGYLKRRYQTAFKEAFAAAIADLTAEQRTLLRMHLFDKLTIDDLARLHRVHRTSTARWLREAREVISEGTRRRLRDMLGVVPEELDSIMNIVRSRLDLSLSRLFAGE